MESDHATENRAFTFIGGLAGPWRVIRVDSVLGASLPAIARIDVVNSLVVTLPPGATWLLRGVTSNERYVTREERAALGMKQPLLARPEAKCAALIPIRKSAAWWNLTQDERRTVFETRSGHIRIGLEYLPAVARRLHHSRDLGEPFDFLTWFEYSPEHEGAFERLVVRLRASEEWTYVDRELDIRLVRDVAV